MSTILNDSAELFLLPHGSNFGRNCKNIFNWLRPLNLKLSVSIDNSLLLRESQLRNARSNCRFSHPNLSLIASLFDPAVSLRAQWQSREVDVHSLRYFRTCNLPVLLVGQWPCICCAEMIRCLSEIDTPSHSWHVLGRRSLIQQSWSQSSPLPLSFRQSRRYQIIPWHTPMTLYFLQDKELCWRNQWLSTDALPSSSSSSTVLCIPSNTCAMKRTTLELPCLPFGGNYRAGSNFNFVATFFPRHNANNNGHFISDLSLVDHEQK